MFKKITRIAVVLALLTFIGLTIAYVSFPSPWRALTPTWFGTEKVAENIYIDDPALTSQAVKFVENAKQVSSDFFGFSAEDPRYVICTTSQCQDRFGVAPKGLALGDAVIMIMPDGFSQTIFTHERVHIDLHSLMGISDVFDPRFPAWFDEGLASYLSKDTRFEEMSNEDAEWIKSAHTFRDWGQLTREHGWPKTYGAAKTLVEALYQELGRDGLRMAIEDTAMTKDLEAALSKAKSAQQP